MRPSGLSLRDRAAQALTSKHQNLAVVHEEVAVLMSTDPLVGAEFAGYRIRRPIGRGGMGAVYLADSAAHDGQVAIKVMLPELTGNEEFRQRFIREAQSGLEHPNIVPILDAGDVDGVLYITMSHIDGIDLKALVTREENLPAARVVAILEQAAGALDHAHENGIVHRDVKPQNILVREPEGSRRVDAVYLTDFGLVKRISSQSSFTTSAYLMGTLHYMAPEQIEGKPLDGRTDVYALGCVIFECLTGKVPFDKESEVAVLWSHMNDEPPSAVALEPLLPDAVDLVLAKAMAKSPDDRFLTAGEFASSFALEFGGSRGRVRSVWGPGQISASGKRSRPLQKELAARAAAMELPEPPPAAPRTKGFLVGAAAAFALFGVWFGFGDADRRAAIGDFVDKVADVATLDSTEKEGAASRATDDRSSDATSVLGQRLRASDGTPTDMSLADIGKDVVQNSPERATEDPQPDRPSEQGAVPATPSGKIVFSRSEDSPVSYYSLYTMDADGSNQRLLYSTSVQRNDYDPDWSPDGKLIAFASEFSIKTIRADGTGETTIESLGGWSRDPTWSPDGEYVAFGHNPQTGDENRRTGEWDIWVAPADTSWMASRLTESPGLDQWPDWSPDGSRIAFASERRGDGWDICYVKIETLTEGCLTSRPGKEMHPAWSPDGSKLAFVGNSSSGRDIFVKNLRTQRVRRVTRNGRAYHPGWSPDGQWIVFSNGRAEEWEASIANQELRRVRASGGKTFTLTETSNVVEAQPDWWGPR